MSDKSNPQGLNQQVIKMMAFNAGLAVLENFSGTASPTFKFFQLIRDAAKMNRMMGDGA